LRSCIISEQHYAGWRERLRVAAAFGSSCGYGSPFPFTLSPRHRAALFF
jgi:hypothetical protein